MLEENTSGDSMPRELPAEPNTKGRGEDQPGLPAAFSLIRKDVCSPCHFLHAPAKKLGTVASCNNDAIEFGVLWRTRMRPSLP